MASFDFASHIIDIPDYPQPGVVFKDITPLLSDAEALHAVVEALADHYKDSGVTKIVAPEARGFMVGTPVANRLGVGFIPARKPGKLPRETVSVTYDLEYGTDTIEIHKDAIEPGDKVVILDDLIATGGTVQAVAKIVESMGAELIGFGCILELSFLNPREVLAPAGEYDVFSLITA